MKNGEGRGGVMGLMEMNLGIREMQRCCSKDKGKIWFGSEKY